MSTHPIQYYAPLFRRLAERGIVDVHVFYGWRGAVEAIPDRGFGATFAWDVPLLDGYPHTFVENVSDDPGTHHAAGIDAPGMVGAVRAWRPDAVLVFGWNYRAHQQVMRAFHGEVPVLFRGDSTLVDERPGLKGWPRRLARRAFLRWTYRRVDHAVYVGTHNKEYFRAHGLREDQLTWAPHSVDNDRFADNGEDAVEWRRSLRIRDDERTVVFVGKLEPKKAPDILLDAFLMLNDPSAHLLFCGTGPLERDLLDRSSGHGNVHFLGFQNQSRMPAVYRLGDVVALPSRGPGETWGLAVNEAMASGRAVVVSDRVGCAPDLVTPENGGVVLADDPGALASALRRALASGVAERMGERSRAVIRDWSFDETASGIERAVRRSLAHR
ncbi:glycosyltransferase family 4 protein [Rubrivirga sp.]|uniref:glycosyltransferase family 4 protein n=1 Tax=Rubrivirga sp. TaxID=1885344 RepID=UPI003B51B726